MTFELFVTPAARRRIRDQAEWIANEQAAPEHAVRWLERVYDAVRGLESMPRRGAIAREDSWCDFEVRKLSVGAFTLFYTVLNDAKQVWVMHAKHGRQLSREADFRDWEPPGGAG